MTNKLAAKRWVLVAGFLTALAGVVVVLVEKHPVGAVFTSALTDAGVDAGRSLARPATIEVPTAAIDQGNPQIAGDDLPPVADVGIADSSLVGPTSPRTQESQSDAEAVDVLAEPIHPVAPVPTQQVGLAALQVRLANASPPPARLRPPLPIAIVTADILRTPVRNNGDLETQFDVAQESK